MYTTHPQILNEFQMLSVSFFEIPLAYDICVFFSYDMEYIPTIYMYNVHEYYLI